MELAKKTDDEITLTDYELNAWHKYTYASRVDTVMEYLRYLTEEVDF